MFVAERATLVHGYTMADVDRLTRWAINQISRWGVRSLDDEDLWEIAWYSVVERLYDATKPQPTRSDLVIAGAQGVTEAVRAQQQFYGAQRAARGGGEVLAFSKYWRPVAGDDDFTERMAERLTLPVVLGELTGDEYEAIVTLAAHGSVTSAAGALGLDRSALGKRLQKARRKILLAWFDDETPPQRRKARSDACASGHSRSEHGYRLKDGQLACRLCRRNTARRLRARTP